jgi:hypothetical protein
MIFYKITILVKTLDQLSEKEINYNDVKKLATENKVKIAQNNFVFFGYTKQKSCLIDKK